MASTEECYNKIDPWCTVQTCYCIDWLHNYDGSYMHINHFIFCNVTMYSLQLRANVENIRS